MDLPRAVVVLLLLGQTGRTLDGEVSLVDLLEPLDGSVVAILSGLRHLLGVGQGEDIVGGDIDGEHQNELMSLSPSSREYSLAVVAIGEVATHQGDGIVLASLEDLGVVVGVGLTCCGGLLEDCAEDLSVQRGVVVCALDEVAHNYMRNGLASLISL